MSSRITMEFVEELKTAVRSAGNSTAAHALVSEMALLVTKVLRARAFSVGDLSVVPPKDTASLIFGLDVNVSGGCRIQAPVWSTPLMEGPPDFRLSTRVDLASRIHVPNELETLNAHTVVAHFTTITGFDEDEHAASSIFTLALPNEGGDCQAMSQKDLSLRLEEYVTTMRVNMRDRRQALLRDVDEQLMEMLEALTP